jgi:hypothetical protein
MYMLALEGPEGRSRFFPTCAAGRCAKPEGRKIVNVVPTFKALSAVIFPPWR